MVRLLSADFARLGHDHAFGTVSLDNLSDVVITLASLGDYLRFNGTNWVDVAVLQLLTDLLTVDGAGSGLDADLLDGLNSTAFQPIDAFLTSIALLGTAADRIIYTTGIDTAAETVLTAFIRTLLDDVDQAAARVTLGLTPGTNVQAFDAFLTSIALLGTAADRMIYTTGIDTAAETILTSYIRTLLDDANAAAARVTLELVIGTNVQAWDADLDALAALASTAGMLSRTGAGAFAVRTLTAPAAGITISNGTGAAGNPTWALANDLSALEALASTGFAARTTTDTWAQRTLTAPAAGFTITNPAGVAGNPTFVLANDLSALEGLGSTGIAARTAADTWAQRTISPGAGITVTNGDGVSGNPVIAITGGQVVNTFRQPGCRGLWSMDSFGNDGELFDLSGNGRTMTRSGPEFNFDTLIPYAEFDGSNDFFTRVDEPGTSIIGTEACVNSAVRGLTIMAWVNPQGAGGSSTEGIVSKSGSYYLQFFDGATDDLKFSVMTSSVIKTVTLTSAFAALNGWYFIAGRYIPGTELKAWANDVTPATNVTSIGATIDDTTNAFVIGNSDGVQPFDGRISVVGIYAMALSDTIVDYVKNQTRIKYGV